MDCARWLVAESMNTKIPLPAIYVHSANPIGSANMMGYIVQEAYDCTLRKVVGNYVPAPAVIRRPRALSGFIGRKACVGGFVRPWLKPTA